MVSALVSSVSVFVMSPNWKVAADPSGATVALLRMSVKLPAEAEMCTGSLVVRLSRLTIARPFGSVSTIVAPGVTPWGIVITTV